MFMKHYAPNRCEPSIEVIMQMGVQWVGFGFWGGCQGGCERERRIEVIVKIKKNGGGGSGQGEYERRFEVFVKMQKKNRGGGLGGVWGDPGG